MHRKLCIVKCKYVLSVHKILPESVITAYLVYLSPCVANIIARLCKHILTVEGKISPCHIKRYHKQIRAACGLGKVDYLPYIALGDIFSAKEK